MPLDEIESRRKSDVSMMPDGLLNDLTMQQVQDFGGVHCKPASVPAGCASDVFAVKSRDSAKREERLMALNRRTMMLGTAAAAGCGLTCVDGAVTEDVLIQAANKPVLKRNRFERPILIDSVDFYRAGNNEFVRVRSRDGAEGISLTNSRGSYLLPILRQLIVPYFIGKGRSRP